MKSRKRKGFFGAVCLVVCLVVCLICVACFPLRHLPDYRSRGFSATLLWESFGVKICAALEVEEEREGETRSYSLTFSEPSSMKGMVFSCRDGVIGWQCEGISWSGNVFGDPSECGAWMIVEGKMERICRARAMGEEIVYAEIQGIGGKTYGLYLNEKTGVPYRIEEGDRVVEIRNFQYLT